MRQRYEEIAGAGGEAIAIGFGPTELLRGLASELDLPFPLLVDPDRSAYGAFGLTRGSFRSVYGPRTLLRYLRLMLRGRRLRRTEADPYQLGGDFVLDREGVIRLAHRSRDPADRPTVDELIEALGGRTP